MKKPSFDGALCVAYKKVHSLVPFARNARTHSKKQLDQLERSITEFGFTNPVLIDPGNGIIAGHGRVLAAEQLGMKEVPTICLEHLTHEQKRAYIIADNKLAELAGWDEELLALEFEYLHDLNMDLDLTITGFEMGEIDFLIESKNSDAEADEVVELLAEDHEPITQLGDVWQLDQHRICCGDSTSGDAMQLLMNGKQATMVFCDPPYNVPINGHVSGLGSIKHREFAMASGEMSQSQFTDFLSNIMQQMVAVSNDGAIHYICMDWRHVEEIIAASKNHYSELKNICVWNKDNGGMGAFYRSKHEFVFAFKVGTAKHINNFELGQHGRYRTNVWDYAGVNTMKAGRLEELAMHPTVKPTDLVADAIMDCSNRGDIVLDSFLGSGTTIIAAEKTGRIGYGLELDPIYVDTTIMRWQKETGKIAIHAESGKPFPNPEQSQSSTENQEIAALTDDAAIIVNTTEKELENV